VHRPEVLAALSKCHEVFMPSGGLTRYAAMDLVRRIIAALAILASVLD
jgi:hypothetical protein